MLLFSMRIYILSYNFQPLTISPILHRLYYLRAKMSPVDFLGYLKILSLVTALSSDLPLEVSEQ